MVLFDRDDGPGRCATVVAEVRRSSKHMKKLLAKALFDRNVEKVVGFLRIRKSARDEILNVFCLKTIGFFMVLC